MDYVAFAPSDHGRPVAAQGLAAIADVLATGLRFISGSEPEPAAIAEQSADVALVAGTHVSALTQAEAASQNPLTRRYLAYRTGLQWEFDDAETAFGQLASPGTDGSASAAARAEALYNLALSVSNQGRFAEADVYFGQADALARSGGRTPGLTGLALNYKAAHARNQGDYADAVSLADQAMAVRRLGAQMAPVAIDNSGAVVITEAGGADATDRITPVQRETLRDVQAEEIKSTSLEALGRKDEAGQAIDLALAGLDQALFQPNPNKPKRYLGLATPWLNARVHADRLRLDQGTGQAPLSAEALRSAIVDFNAKYPGSLPAAGFLIELARGEAALSQSGGVLSGGAEENLALADYETAFNIFRDQRGSLAASADLVGPYFDILLRRIGGAPANDQPDVMRFFAAAQTLVTQSSAEAAKQQAAQTMAGDAKTAGLARALEDTGRSLDQTASRINDLQLRGKYQGDDKARLDAEQRSLAAQKNTLEAELLDADPNYASALPRVIDLADLQKRLQPGEVYVKAFMLAGRGYGVLVSPTDATPYAIDMTRDQALAMVDGLRKPIDHPRILPDGSRSLGRYDVALAHQAFGAVFGPVQASVLAAKHIVYEPDASLIGAPIAAFVVDDASVQVMKANLLQAQTSSTPLNYVGVAWLGSKTTSSVALSASAFVQACANSRRPKAPYPFYGFGDPQISQDPRAFADVRPTGLASDSAQDFCAQVRAALFRMPALPETADEVRTVATSLGQDASTYALGGAFTDSGIQRRGLSARDHHKNKVLYLPTHGILPQADGCVRSALLTSLGEGDSDALLDVRKIPDLVLDADMVVLSACDTGRTADGGDGGEALGGLVSTFVEAGARNLVVSNWEVDTKATEQLMTAMFADKGASQADALAQAERGLMASPDQYSHPYFWAPFMVVGDGARLMPAV